MKLKKRVYLLTPVLVLVCIIAAGVFIKAPADIEAAAGAQYNIADWSSIKLKDIIEIEKIIGSEDWAKCIDSSVSTEDKEAILTKNNIDISYLEYIEYANRYDIKEFSSHLFDYDGYNWNAFSAFRFNDDKSTIFAFTNIGKDQKYDYYDGTEDKAYSYYNKGINAGGVCAKQGIFESLLDNSGFPNFTFGGIQNADAGGFREHMLFDPSGDYTSYPKYSDMKYWTDEGYTFDLDSIRKAYKADFEFVYDKQTGYYTYNSKQNHAQYNELTGASGNNISEGKIELYTDTLSTSNGMVDNKDLLGNVWFDRSGGCKTTQSGNKYKIQFVGDANDRFIAALEMKKFRIPLTNTTNTTNLSDSDATNDNMAIPSVRLNNVYVKFNIKSSIAEESADLKFKIVLSDKKPTGGHVFIVGQGGNLNTTNGNCYVYDYDYTLTGTSQTFELQFQVNNTKIAEFTSIPYIYIVPVASNVADFYEKYESNSEYIEFEILEYQLGFDGGASGASFLPFHNIDNSYKGERKGESPILSERLEYWDSNLRTTTTSHMATRAVEEANVKNLQDLDANDYGGTAAHFGLSLEIDFFMPVNKKAPVDSNLDGVADTYEDIIFTFTGDDDMWVFVDDYLLLDIGGNHTAEKGTINFTTGEVTYGNLPIQNISLNSPYQGLTGGGTRTEGKKVDQYLNEITGNSKDIGTSVFGAFSYTFAELKEEAADQTRAQEIQKIIENLTKPGKHTMKIFYMERAAGSSNCFMSFNLPQVPEGALTVSKEIDIHEDSKIEMPVDFNINGGDIADNLVAVKNSDNTIGYIDANGNKIEDGKGLLTYTFEAEYKVRTEYITTNNYDHHYNIYKTDNAENVKLTGLELTDVNAPYIDGAFTVYNVRFDVPIGYTATIFLPEFSVITKVMEIEPMKNDVNIDKNFYYVGNLIDSSASRLQSGTYELLDDSLSFYGNVVIGADTAVNLKYTTYYKADVFDLQIEKIFEDSDPVPVGHSILFKVEGEGLEEPLFVTMVIQATEVDGVSVSPNPNVVTVKDLLKGSYVVTEISDWSWRYECYDVQIQRDDADVYGDGTIISVTTPAA